jgi:hypothetical protein
MRSTINTWPNTPRCSAFRPEVKRAIAQHAILDRVREDFMSGVRSGVNGTPTFFVNGVRHDGSYDRDNLLAAIAEAGQCWIQVAAIERVPAELGIIVAVLAGTIAASAHVSPPSLDRKITVVAVAVNAVPPMISGLAGSTAVLASESSLLSLLWDCGIMFTTRILIHA